MAAATATITSAAEKPNSEPLHIVLLADEKDHGPAGNGLHDYPLWQKRWALLLGGEEASDEKQVNLAGPPDEIIDHRKGITPQTARGQPHGKPLGTPGTMPRM